LGDDRANLLGVEAERWDEAILACAEFLNKGINDVTEHSKLIAGLNGFFARHLVLCTEHAWVNLFQGHPVSAA
jgi:hypothetical protein